MRCKETAVKNSVKMNILVGTVLGRFTEKVPGTAQFFIKYLKWIQNYATINPSVWVKLIMEQGECASARLCTRDISDGQNEMDIADRSVIYGQSAL